MSDIATTIALRAMLAEDAISSTEIENGPLDPVDRFIAKARIIWPGLSDDELDALKTYCAEKRGENVARS